MNKKKKFQLKSKHLLFIMTFLCLSGILGSAADKMPVTPIREAAGFVIIPFQNGINQIGAYLTDCLTGFQNVKKLSAEKEELEQKVTDLTEENNQLVQEQQELQRLQELYQLDQSYSEYEKVAAQVISKDPGNWYDTFVINKGSNDGIQKDMNVIADGGTLGMYLYDRICRAEKLLIFDCCDFKGKPGELRVLRNDDVKLWTATKISPHQTGMNDLLVAAAVRGAMPNDIAVVGFQPVLLDDYGGSLSAEAKGKVDEAVRDGYEIVRGWNVGLRVRSEDEIPA